MHRDHDRLRRDHRVLGHLHQRADDLGEGHLVARVPRQDLVHQRDGAHPALGLVQRHPGRPVAHPAGLEAEQRRDRLQVVLDPVVHLADGGVLGQEQPVEPAHVGDVAQQDHRPGDHAVGEQRDAVHEHDDVGPALDLLDDRPARWPAPTPPPTPRCRGRRSGAPRAGCRCPCGGTRSWRWARRTRPARRRRPPPRRRPPGAPPRCRRPRRGRGRRTGPPCRPGARTRRGRSARTCSSAP